VGVLGSLPGYATERGLLTGEQYYLLTVARRLVGPQVPASAYLIFVVVVLGAVSLWLLRDRLSDDPRYVRNGLLIASLFVLFLAPHFPWYFSWLVVFLCFVPSVAVFYLTFASFLLYVTWLGDPPERVFVLKSIMFVPFLVLGLISIWRRRR
jgi:hypothetical protein